MVGEIVIYLKLRKMLDVSVIIVNYNTLKMTDECICSVIEKTSGIGYEIILVDNASTDGSKEFFSNDSRVTYIYNDENLGFGRANNIGIEIAQGRNILFLNSDTLLRNNAIKILSNYLDSHPEAGACGGNLFLPDGTPTMSFCRYIPSLYEEINLLFGEIPNLIRFGKNIRFNYSHRPIKVGFISGADLMVKHITLDKTGHFNPNFFMYYEDTELCARIKRFSQDVVSIPQAEITHYYGGKSLGNSTGESYLKYRLVIGKSKLIFYYLTYNQSYWKIACFIRELKIHLKLLLPFSSTRRHWKKERDIFKQIKEQLWELPS